MTYGVAKASDAVSPDSDTARYLRLHDDATRTGAPLVAEPATRGIGEGCMPRAQQPPLEPGREVRG
ncbi:MAG TPA: hypothetical protein VLC55_12610 [Burkholderiales bacterium]|nr:hypothetical protein [Burkholderiales bacterium]